MIRGAGHLTETLINMLRKFCYFLSSRGKLHLIYLFFRYKMMAKLEEISPVHSCGKSTVYQFGEQD